MIDKILKWATLILLLVLVLKVFGGDPLLLGGTVDETTRLAALDLTVDLTVDDSVAIDATRGGRFVSSTIDANAKFGNAANTGVDQLNCGSVEVNLPSLANNATTTFDVTLARIATGTARQAAWVGFNTSTNQFGDLYVWVLPSSTAGTATVRVKNLGGTLDFGIVSSTVCFVEAN